MQTDGTSSGRPARTSAIVWSVELRTRPRAEILFPRGDEDPDHLVVELELPLGTKNEVTARAAAHAILDMSTLQELAELKARARPIDRAAIARRNA